MRKLDLNGWISQPKIKRILLSFSAPRTPRQVEKELEIKKLKLKPFLEKGMLKCLNPVGKKGRFYVLSSKGRRLLGLPLSKKRRCVDWNTIAWIKSSPRLRSVVLRAVDMTQRTSEEIRQRARENRSLTRISTKGVLNELADEGFVTSVMRGRKRYYSISNKGRSLLNDLVKLGLLESHPHQISTTSTSSL